MNVEIHIGNHAMTHALSETFLLKWKALYACCTWATGCQHPDFVMPWYALYRHAFTPVIVVMEAADRSLQGLLTLAYDEKRKRLVGAGERQAEYQGWLEGPGSDNRFIRKAMEETRHRFPGVDITLKYLPPGIPLTWIAAHGDDAKIFSVRSHVRPVMEIDEPAMDRQRRSKNNRQNFNRLNKLGNVEFRKLVDFEQFENIFDEICQQYDFRQGALYHHMPFASDPAKKLFYLELYRRGLLHVTIMTVGGKVAASHCGLITKTHAVHLGITSNDPAFFAHSPGLLHLAMLGVQLVGENVAMLDLTPGGDEYKERFATNHDTVFELTAYGNVKARLRREVFLNGKHFLKQRLSDAGVSTADVRAALDKLTGFRTIGLQGWLKKMHGDAPGTARLYRYCSDLPPSGSRRLAISKNCFKDLFRFDARDALMTRWEFLSTSMRRMESANDLYSFRNGEALLMYCWACARLKRPDQRAAAAGEEPADDAVMLFDLYVHRELDEVELVRHFIEQIVLDLQNQKKGKSVYFRGALNDRLQEVMRQCGFTSQAG